MEDEASKKTPIQKTTGHYKNLDDLQEDHHHHEDQQDQRHQQDPMSGERRERRKMNQAKNPKFQM